MRAHNVLFDMETNTIGMIKSSCKIQESNGVSMQILDPYASLGHILALHRKDLCLKEHKYIFCLETYPFYELHFLLMTLILLLLLTWNVHIEKRYNKDGRLSQLTLRKSS